MPSSLPQHVGVGLPCLPTPAHGRGCSDPGCRKLPHCLTLALCTPLGLHFPCPSPDMCLCGPLTGWPGDEKPARKICTPQWPPHGPCFSNCNLQGRLGAFDFFVWCPAFEQYRGHDQPLPHRHLCHPLGVERSPNATQARHLLCPRAVMSS